MYKSLKNIKELIKKYNFEVICFLKFVRLFVFEERDLVVKVSGIYVGLEYRELLVKEVDGEMVVVVRLCVRVSEGLTDNVSLKC